MEFTGDGGLSLVRRFTGLRRHERGLDLRVVHRPAVLYARTRHAAVPLRRLPRGARRDLAARSALTYYRAPEADVCMNPSRFVLATASVSLALALFAGAAIAQGYPAKPIRLIVSAPVVFVVAASSRYTSLGDLLAAAKTDPGGVTFASPGNGTVSHLAGELLQRAAGVRLTHVPYKGASQALTDTLGGQVQSFMSSVPSALSQIRAGRLRAIAVSSATRARELPEVPTIAEAGYKGFGASTWYGLLAPARTPAPVIARLNAEVNRALKTPEVRERLAAEGGEALGGSPEQFASFLKAEHAKWGRVVKESGAKAE